MKYIILTLSALCVYIKAQPLLAWDGFDADSAELIEIIPDSVPQPGQEIEVLNHDTDTSSKGVVKSVIRNRKTIEVVFQDSEGKLHIFVMEGR